MTRPGIRRRLLPFVGLLAGLAACSAPTSPAPPAHGPAEHVASAPASASLPTANGSSHPTRPLPTRVKVEVLPWRLPEPVAREGVSLTAGGLVVAGGLVAGDRSTSAAYRIDLSNGHITRLPDLAVPVHDVGGALVHGRAEVVGGGNATEQDAVQQFGADGRWRVSGHLPTPRSDLSSVTVGRRVFVVGGYDGTTPALVDVLVSTGGGGFQVFARLRVPVRYAAVALSGGAIWVLGGERSGMEMDAVQRVDLATGHVRVVGHLPHPLGHAVATMLGGRILLAGGRPTGSSVTASMWWFDPRTPDHLVRAGALPSPLADSAVVTVGRSTYLVGGETPDLSNNVVRLTPASDG